MQRRRHGAELTHPAARASGHHDDRRASRAAATCRSTTRSATSRIRHVLARHEQGAGFIAQGMARVTGTPGRLLRHLGPGRDQSADRDRRRQARLDPAGRHHRPGAARDDRHRRVPGDRHLRPHGADHASTTSWCARRPSCSTVVPDAFRIAASGRPGPVVIDVPKDVQNEADRRSTRCPSPGVADPPPRAATTTTSRAPPRCIDAARAPGPPGRRRRDRARTRATRCGGSPSGRRSRSRRRCSASARCRRPSARPRHGRHARRALHQPRAGGVRPADRRSASASTIAPPARWRSSARARRSSTSTSTRASSARSRQPCARHGGRRRRRRSTRSRRGSRGAPRAAWLRARRRRCAPRTRS